MPNKMLFDGVINKANEIKKEGHRPLAVFDLDGTLFYYTMRVRHILLDALKGKDKEFPGARTLIEHIPHTEYEYLVVDTLKKYDIDIPGLSEHLLAFWERWFFDNQYLKYDQPIPGAIEFVNDLVKNGITVIYLSGRDTPRMGKGTIESLKKSGFPVDANRTIPMLKPKFEDDNWAHKNMRMNEIKQLGKVAAAFDNEPGEVNILADHFPDAIIVMVESLHSPNAPEPRQSVQCIRNFNDGYII